MTPESFDLAGAWMVKARSDLETAQLLIRGGEKHLDTGCYHCQQAAEKALKGWLTASELLFPKTHILEQILALCVPSNAAFARFDGHCEELTPFAQEFRYPGDIADPTPEQAERALVLAEEICRFVESAFASLDR